jgi:hypothetical protein
MVFCSTANRDRYNGFIKRYSTAANGGGVFRVSDCYVWLPRLSSIRLADGTTVVPEPYLN